MNITIYNTLINGPELKGGEGVKGRENWLVYEVGRGWEVGVTGRKEKGGMGLVKGCDIGVE